jgi:hypothetical protein
MCLSLCKSADNRTYMATQTTHRSRPRSRRLQDLLKHSSPDRAVERGTATLQGGWHCHSTTTVVICNMLERDSDRWSCEMNHIPPSQNHCRKYDCSCSKNPRSMRIHMGMPYGFKVMTISISSRDCRSRRALLKSSFTPGHTTLAR